MNKYILERKPRKNPFWILHTERDNGVRLFLATGKDYPSVCYYSSEETGLRFIPRWPDMPYDFNLPSTIEAVNEIAKELPAVAAMVEPLETAATILADCATGDAFREHPNFVLMTDIDWSCNLFGSDDLVNFRSLFYRHRVDVVEHFHSDVSDIVRAPADLDAYIYQMPVPWMAVKYTRGSEVIYRDHYLLANRGMITEDTGELTRVWTDWLLKVYDASHIVRRFNAMESNRQN